jgi:hypothetical protein
MMNETGEWSESTNRQRIEWDEQADQTRWMGNDVSTLGDIA